VDELRRAWEHALAAGNEALADECGPIVGNWLTRRGCIPRAPRSRAGTSNSSRTVLELAVLTAAHPPPGLRARLRWAIARLAER
jgi:hypothetical protein